VKTLALRVDVDTLEGTLRGIPILLRLLDRYRMQASFFVSLGPDNSGKALRRLFRPGFFSKMRRTKALRLYGLKTLLYGTLLPAPIIHRKAAATLRSIEAEGHEVGLHAWDHVQYHDLLDRRSEAWLKAWFDRAHEAFSEVFGPPPQGAVSPAWRCNDRTLLLQEGRGLAYAGDCRGTEPFYPVVQGRVLSTLQIPTTLPTVDELLGLDGRGPQEVNQAILAGIREDALNVYALHTEVEGGVLADAFEALLKAVKAEGIAVRTHRDWLPELKTQNPPARVLTRREIPGRAGWVSWGA